MKCRKVKEYMEPVIKFKMALKQYWWPRNHYRYYDVSDQMKFISHSGGKKNHAVRKAIKNYYTCTDINDVYWGHSNTVHLLYIAARISKSVHFNRLIILG